MGRLGTIMIGIVVAAGAALLVARLFSPERRPRRHVPPAREPLATLDDEPVATDETTGSHTDTTGGGPPSNPETEVEQSGGNGPSARPEPEVEPHGGNDPLRPEAGAGTLAASEASAGTGESRDPGAKSSQVEAADSDTDVPGGTEFVTQGGLTLPYSQRRGGWSPAPPVHPPRPVPPNFGSLAENFSGLFTSLKLAARGRMNATDTLRLLKSWERRIRESHDEEITLEWQSLVSHAFGQGSPPLGQITHPAPQGVERLAREWLERLRSWGLREDAAETLVLDDDLSERYVIGDDRLQPGMRAQVVHGCWSVRGTVVEKGVVTAGV